MVDVLVVVLVVGVLTLVDAVVAVVFAVAFTVDAARAVVVVGVVVDVAVVTGTEDDVIDGDTMGIVVVVTEPAVEFAQPIVKQIIADANPSIDALAARPLRQSSTSAIY